MGYLINPTLEFCEIVNAFPVLRGKFEHLDVDLDNLREGESLHDYFERKRYSEDEIDILVKNLNNDIKYFLKRGRLPCFGR